SACPIDDLVRAVSGITPEREERLPHMLRNSPGLGQGACLARGEFPRLADMAVLLARAAHRGALPPGGFKRPRPSTVKAKGSTCAFFSRTSPAQPTDLRSPKIVGSSSLTVG